MKLILTDDNGTVLDSTTITRAEWDNLTPIGALALLDDMRPGLDAE